MRNYYNDGMDMNIIHIDKNTLLRSLYLFQFTFYGNNLMNSELIRGIEEFVERHTQQIALAPNLLLLYTLDKEKKFLTELKTSGHSLSLKDFSMVCIDKGFMISSWLKKL